MARKLVNLFFGFRGRIGRETYLLCCLALIVIVVAAVQSSRWWSEYVLDLGLPWLLLAGLVALSWPFAALGAKRAHDIGENYFKLRLIDDLFVLRLLTEEGDANPNLYGPTPDGLVRRGPLRFPER